jgi:protoporphyrinogen/coproporphyrinogen III oxidase
VALTEVVWSIRHTKFSVRVPTCRNRLMCTRGRVGVVGHAAMLRRGHWLSCPRSLYRPTAPSASLLATRRHNSSAPETSFTENNVAVLGGGISGLACAYYLTKELPTAKVTVYEAADRIGGWLYSERVPVQGGDVLLEAGPRTLRPNGNGALSCRLLQELDLAKDAIYPQKTSAAAINRYVYYPDHLVRMMDPSFRMTDVAWSMMTEPIFEGAMWAALREIFLTTELKAQDESIGDFFGRQFSTNVVDRILSAVIHGIYAGDVYQLSAKSLFPKQWRAVAEKGSVLHAMAAALKDGIEVTKRESDFLHEMKRFNWDPLLRATLRDTTVFTFKDGLGMLVDRLARHLVQDGNVEFRTSTPVESISPDETGNGVIVRTKGSDTAKHYSHAISALSPAQLNFINKPSTDVVSRQPLVPHIPSVTVMVVNLYYRTPNLHPPGFGYLIPQAIPFENNPENALGVVFDTACSPGPDELNVENWDITNTEELRQARERGHLINIRGFGWYNMPDKPNTQDNVTVRGTKLTVMLGGHWWNDWPAYPDEQEGLALAKSVVERHLGIKEEPEVYRVNLHKDCIPQYTVGHERRLQDAHNNIWREYKGRLRVAGNWMSGVGVNDCLRSAFDVVRGLAHGRDGTGLEHVGREEYVRLKPRAKANGWGVKL